MKKELINYFNSLKEIKLPQNKGCFFEDGINIRKYNSEKFNVRYGNIFSYLFGDQLMYVKPVERISNAGENIFEIISGDYFNNTGSCSVVGYPVEVKIKGDYTGRVIDYYAIATHNLKAIGAIEIIPGGELLHPNGQPSLNLSKENWFLLKDTRFSDRLKSIMTPDCFNEYLNLFLADKLGTYSDRHGYNYFFYRKYGSRLWEGVIAIDNSMTAVGDVVDKYGIAKEDFDCFLKNSYKSFTPQGSKNENSHIENIRELNNLIVNGEMGESQLKALKKIIKYPYEDNLEKACEKYCINSGKLKDNVSRLWEYNRENIKTR